MIEVFKIIKTISQLHQRYYSRVLGVISLGSTLLIARDSLAAWVTTSPSLSSITRLTGMIKEGFWEEVASLEFKWEGHSR